MKICYLLQDLGIPLDGHKGATSHVRGFVNALEDLGHEVTIITSCPVESDHGIKGKICVIPKPDVIKGLSRKKGRRVYNALRHIFYNVSMEKTLDQVISMQKPDIIYERYSPYAAAGGIAAKERGIPHLLEVNSPLAEQGKLYRNQALQEAAEYLEIAAFTNSSLIITLANELRDWLISLGIAPETIHVRPCGVDDQLFTPNGPTAINDLSEKTVIGFVGTLKPWHDIELLVKSFRVLAKNPKYHLLIVGKGPMQMLIDDLSDEFPGRVTITGAIEQKEVPTYIRAMDICVAPYPKLSLFYFSPLKAYEYMAMGKAIVSTGIGQLNQLIEHQKTGLLVPPGNIDAFVQAIETLSNNHELRATLGQNAREKIIKTHTWTQRAKLFIDIVENNLIKKYSHV